MRLRAAKVSDAAELARLRMDFLAEIGPLRDRAATQAANERYFRTALKSQARAWVVEAEGQIIGTSALALYERGPSPRNPTGREGYLFSMYTLPAWRRRGIAG